GCPGVVRHGMGYRLKVGAYRLVKKFAPAFAEQTFGSGEYRSLSPIMKESYKLIVNEDLVEAAKQIASPVLFVYGKQDKTTPARRMEPLFAATKNAERAILPGCGHFAFLDDPVRFRMAVEVFLTAKGDEYDFYSGTHS
ncbi:MAG: alpha/beta fold hydrolase, partial [Christensenellaceae bacterium]